MEIVGIFLWIAVFAVFFGVLSHLIPFFKGKAYYTVRESSLRILLTCFLIFVPFFLVIVFLFPLFRIGIPSILDKIAVVWPDDKTGVLFASSSILFFLISGIAIPAAAIFHFFFGYRLFLRANKKYELSSGLIKGNATVQELFNVFSSCLEIAGLKKEVKVFLLDEESRTSPIFSGCGVVGKGENLALLFSKDFIKAFEDKKLEKQEVEAIFFHEIGHVVNKDYFLPLWSKMFIRSRLFFVAWAALMMGAVCASGVSFKTEGLSAIFNWSVVARAAILTFGFVLLRGVISAFISGILREREYLADRHATYHYTDQKTMIGTIKKAALLFTGGSRFSWFSFGQSDSAVHATTKALKETGIFMEFKQLFSDIMGKRVIWHPDPMKRIKALSEERVGLSRKKAECSSLSDIVILTLFLSMLLFGLGFLFEFLVAGLGKGGYISINNLATACLILLYPLAICSLVIEHIIPLQFRSMDLFQKSLIGSISGFSIRKFLFLFLTGKIWREIHLKNFFIALIPCLFGMLLSSIFSTGIKFLQWYRIYPFRTFFVFFAGATLFSVFLVISYWREKKKKGPGKEEVPAEMIVE